MPHFFQNRTGSFYELALPGIWRGSIESLHAGDMARGKMVALIFKQFPELLGKHVLIPLPVLRVQDIVMIPRMPFRAEPEGLAAPVPVIPPFIPAHSIPDLAVNIEVIAETRKRPETAAGYAGSVRGFHDKFGFGCVDASVENDRVYVETPVNLRHL